MYEFSVAMACLWVVVDVLFELMNDNSGDCFASCLVFWLGFGFSVEVFVFDGEFDPGSGRTLAACLTHASRAERPFWGYSSGERVSNT